MSSNHLVCVHCVPEAGISGDVRIPAALAAPYKPLPFAYLSTGEETLFINHFDPHPRTRPVFSFHRPDTLREWLTADTLDAWLKRSGGFYTAADETNARHSRAGRRG